MYLYLDFPIEIGEDFRRKTLQNFKLILRYYKRMKEDLHFHKVEETRAHNARNITYRMTNVSDTLDDVQGQINALVLGANGDSMQEIRQARSSLDGVRHDLLADRIRYDLNSIIKKAEDNKEFLLDYFYYINVKSKGAKGDGETDETTFFNSLDDNTIYYVPEGKYIMRSVPEGYFFGEGRLIIDGYEVPLSKDVAQPVNRNRGTNNKEVYYSFVVGQDAGVNQDSKSYANTGVGYAVFRHNERGRRLTAMGKGAMDNMVNGYSNDAFGSDALGQGKYGQRNTAIGANALKWGGTVDPIATLHDFWLKKDTGNMINSFFKKKWDNIWFYLGNENEPKGTLLSHKDEDFSDNVGIGRNALLHSMKANGNTAVGYNAQAHSIEGDDNTSIGNRAMRDNMFGTRNTALGGRALLNNITGKDNVSVGSNNLQQVIHASNNTVVGYGAMHFFKDDNNKDIDDYEAAQRNTAVGSQAMQDGKNANYSVMVGSYAGRYVEGNYNVGVGAGALPKVTKGEQNVAIGGNGLREIKEGSNNVAIGYSAGPNKDYKNTVSLGYGAHANGDNEVQLGSSDSTVYAHKEIQQRSDKRDKKDIKETEFGLNFINELKPVDFKYKNSNSDRFHHGLIAQDVEKLKDKGYDFGGLSNSKYNGGEDVYSIGYTQLISPLIKSVQELNKKVNNQQETIDKQQKQIDKLEKQMAKLLKEEG